MPLRQFKAWLRGDDARSDDSGDLLAERTEAEDDAEASRENRSPIPSHRSGVTWNGAGCRVAAGHKDELTNVHPNSLIVLPATAGGWTSLGHIPEAPPEPEVLSKSDIREFTEADLRDLARIDVATEGFRQSRDREILRVHPCLMTAYADRAALTLTADTAAPEGLWSYVNENASWKHSALAITEDDAAEDMISTDPESAANESLDAGRSTALLATRTNLAKKSAKQTKMIRYPGGFVVIGPRLNPRKDLPRASFDDELEEHNLEADERISLVDHLAVVALETERLVESIDLPAGLRQALVAAAERHDLGKADLRFQALLLNSSLALAAMQPELWAKSPAGAAVRSLRTSSRHTESADRLPRGFRHEMLSVELSRQVEDGLDEAMRDVMLHAIAAHHGHARPFAPVVVDDSPPDVHLRLAFASSNERLEVTLPGADRLGCPAHRLDSEFFGTLLETQPAIRLVGFGLAGDDVASGGLGRKFPTVEPGFTTSSETGLPTVP